MTARPVNRDAQPARSDRAIDNATTAGAIQTDERGCTSIWGAGAEEVLHATQIPEPLLADRGDEGDRQARFQLLLLHDARDRDHGRKPARIVGDAGGQDPHSVLSD